MDMKVAEREYTIADLVAEPGGFEAVRNRIVALRRRGLDAAADAIEHELDNPSAPDDRPDWL